MKKARRIRIKIKKANNISLPNALFAAPAPKTKQPAGLIKNGLVKIAALLLIVGMNFSALLTIGSTAASFSDQESSVDNSFEAGVLDFSLQSPADFDLACGTTTRMISLLNNGNPFKYTASSTDFSGDVCDYINLTANVNGGAPEYVGPLKEFKYGPSVFSDSADWLLEATFNNNLPAGLVGQTCVFKFVFDGSQTKNDLPFGEGFSDSEEIINHITAQNCYQGCQLRLSKTTSSTQVKPGDFITYHLTLDNVGGEVCTGSGVLLKDMFDKTKLRYIRYYSNRAPNEFTAYSSYLQWNFGNIYPDDPLIEIDVKMKVRRTACWGKCGHIITNFANFWSDQTDWGQPVKVETPLVCHKISDLEENSILDEEAIDDSSTDQETFENNADAVPILENNANNLSADSETNSLEAEAADSKNSNSENANLEENDSGAVNSENRSDSLAADNGSEESADENVYSSDESESSSTGLALEQTDNDSGDQTDNGRALSQDSGAENSQVEQSNQDNQSNDAQVSPNQQPAIEPAPAIEPQLTVVAVPSGGDGGNGGNSGGSGDGAALVGPAVPVDSVVTASE